ncbi:hypothetical protein, partial [Ferrimonas pelagia]|uniref:hypothetical protein n=1 Tax=Ferrimonas pelagia TaxID=1177826 RepID=UPI0031EC7A1C
LEPIEFWENKKQLAEFESFHEETPKPVLYRKYTPTNNSLKQRRTLRLFFCNKEELLARIFLDYLNGHHARLQHIGHTKLKLKEKIFASA